jgi:streptomycin 6-kinase
MPAAMPSGWPEDWGVAQATLLSDGIGGKVWRVALHGGGSAIVKHLSELAIRDRAEGEGWLRWRSGSGAVRLLDRRGPMLLLEDAAGPSLLDVFQRHGDDAATEIAGWVLRGLNTPAGAPAPSGLISLRENFEGLFARARQEAGRTRFVEAAEGAERLLAGQREQRPLHGDFHHENVLLSPRGWLVIDPRGVVGDPGYEAANWFYNPLESDARYRPDRALEVAAALAPALDRPAEILLDWGAAHAALSAAWHLEDGNTGEAEKSLLVWRAVTEAARQVRS